MADIITQKEEVASLDSEVYSAILSNSIPFTGSVHSGTRPNEVISENNVSSQSSAHLDAVNDLSEGSNAYDEYDDLLSEATSDTTFFDEEASSRGGAASNSENVTANTAANRSGNTPIHTHSEKEAWTFTPYRTEGKVYVIGEWTAKTKSHRHAVIGPDWPCAVVTYICIIVPGVFVYKYIIENIAEEVVFFLLFGLCLFGLTAVFIVDPGLVRKYHHARSRHWTYCDHCESFRPPNTVHCSTCQVCIAGYDHHCVWTSKCIGQGNILYFKLFIISLCWLILYAILLAILFAAHVGTR